MMPSARRTILLDGSIVIKSMGSSAAAALTCPMDLTPHLGMGTIEASTIRMHYGAREDMQADRRDAARRSWVISRLFAR